MSNCPHCSKGFTLRAINQIYCSQRCAHNAEKKRSRQREREALAIARFKETGLMAGEKFCEECGTKFKMQTNSSKYCGEPCRLAGHKKAADARYEREKLLTESAGPRLKRCDCTQCGKTFYSKRTVKICSETCRRERQKSHYRRTTHGVEDSAYDKMLRDQEAKCLICKEIKRLVIDHCHENGHVRGLLCSNCNTGLGYFGDNTENLSSAIQYLRERGTENQSANSRPGNRGPKKIA